MDLQLELNHRVDAQLRGISLNKFIIICFIGPKKMKYQEQLFTDFRTEKVIFKFMYIFLSILYRKSIS